MMLRGGHWEDTHALFVSTFTIASATSGLTRPLTRIKWKCLDLTLVVSASQLVRRLDPAAVPPETFTGFSQERGVIQARMSKGFQFRQAQMKIAGRLLTDLHPNGTVRIVFIAQTGGGNECPVRARNLDGAEIIFLTCGLTPGRAAALRAELERNKVVSVDTSMGETVAAKFRRGSAAGA